MEYWIIDQRGDVYLILFETGDQIATELQTFGTERTRHLCRTRLRKFE